MRDGRDADLNQRIAEQVRDLRAQRGLTLDGLAERSGVSRSMISVIERGETSPTAVLLERLATGLNVPLATLFRTPWPNPEPVSRRDHQIQWRDPGSGYRRRNVSPSNFDSPVQIVEVEFPPGASVSFDAGVRDVQVHQQVWVLDGAIEVTVGEDSHRLETGDCLAFVLDRPTAFRNRSRKTARYAVVIVTQPESLR